MRNREPYTNKACPGCGETGRRHPDKVCRQCQELMADGRRFRSAVAEDARQLYRGPSRGQWPYFSVYGEHLVRLPDGSWGGRVKDPLRAALGAIYLRVVKPLSGEAAWKRCEAAGIRSHEAEAVFLTKDGRPQDEQDQLALAWPEDVAALRQIALLLQEAIDLAEVDGRRRGADLLNQLAANKLALADFNKKAALEEPGATVRRIEYQE